MNKTINKLVNIFEKLSSLLFLIKITSLLFINITSFSVSLLFLNITSFSCRAWSTHLEKIRGVNAGGWGTRKLANRFHAASTRHAKNTRLAWKRYGSACLSLLLLPTTNFGLFTWLQILLFWFAEDISTKVTRHKNDGYELFTQVHTSKYV